MKKKIIDLPNEVYDLQTKHLCHNKIMASTKVVPRAGQTIQEIKLYITPERKEFLLAMADVLVQSTQTQEYDSQYILTGCEGIG